MCRECWSHPPIDDERLLVPWSLTPAGRWIQWGGTSGQRASSHVSTAVSNSSLANRPSTGSIV
jgi:hypothetical protein